MALVLVCHVLFTCRIASAAVYTWNGNGGDVDWSTTGNWVGGTPPVGATTTDIVLQGTNNTGTSGTPLNQDIVNPLVLNSLSFDSSAGNFFITGLDLRFGGANNTITQGSSNAQSIANVVRAPSSGLVTITLAGSGSGLVTLSGVVSSGTAGRDYAIVKTGSSTFALTAVNTYGGATTINGGTLTAAATSGSALGSTSSIAINSGGRLLLDANNQIGNTITMTLAGGTFAKGNFTEGSTSAAGVGTLALTGSDSHLDFGIGTVGTLSFASFAPGGETLLIDNWTGTANTIGTASTDRLVFAADQAANLANFWFTNFDPGAVQFALGGGFFEITPVTVPEPSAIYLAAVSIVGAFAWSRRRRR
jgi:autotransporter-associated beta strand protein